MTGSVYVADTGNNRIQQFSHNGTFISTWGSEGNTNGQFIGPAGIAVNPMTGSVYVADTGNNRIQQFSHKGTFINTWNNH
jgi:DNA-binding beta-propeller fold protein YncE